MHRSLRAFNRGCAESEDAEFNADEDTYVPGFVELKRFAGERGRGLVALRNVRAGKFLLRAPCLRVSRAQYQSHLKFTELEHYVFSLRTGDVLVAFGWGSMFNHSKRPNVNFKVVTPPRGSAVDDVAKVVLGVEDRSRRRVKSQAHEGLCTELCHAGGPCADGFQEG